MFQIRFADFTIEYIRSWRPNRKNKISHLSLPRRHGTLVPDVAFSDELIINLEGECWKPSETELKTYFDDLGARLQNFGKDRLYLRDDGRFVYAICTGTSFPSFESTRHANGVGGNFSLEFTCGDPFWYSATESEDHQTATTSPFTWSITNNGKVRTPIRVHITASGANKTDVKVTNTTTGFYMRYRNQILQGQSVAMNAENSSCLNNGANDLNGFEGAFFLVEPGVNNLSYSGATTVLIDTYWRERNVN